MSRFTVISSYVPTREDPSIFKHRFFVWDILRRKITTYPQGFGKEQLAKSAAKQLNDGFLSKCLSK